MSINFKIKKDISKSNCTIKESNTLEKKYKNKINNFNKNYKNNDKLKIKLDKINNQLRKIDEDRENNIIVDLNSRAKLLDQQKELEDEINNNENMVDEMNYFDDVGELINEYYNSRDSNNKVVESKNILDFFNKEKIEETNISDKEKLFAKYCQLVEGIKINKDDGKNRIIYCECCNIEKILDISKSSYICPQCGDMELIIIDEDRQIKDYSPYKRINHFKEWLNQFQAKETTDISEEIFKDIIKEINKMRIKEYTEITRDRLQSILKKLGYNKLYEHIPFIINKLTNIPAPKIDPIYEKKFINMFVQIQEPWELYKPKGRKNFLSYPYILYKFSELLELDHLLNYFPMLKPSKLMEQDKIWRRFCQHLKWEFYPTT